MSILDKYTKPRNVMSFDEIKQRLRDQRINSDFEMGNNLQRLDELHNSQGNSIVINISEYNYAFEDHLVKSSIFLHKYKILDANFKGTKIEVEIGEDDGGPSYKVMIGDDNYKLLLVEIKQAI